MIAKLSIDSQAVPGFSLRDGVLRLCNRIWIGSNTPLQHRLLEASHSSALGGHSRFPIMYEANVCLERDEICCARLCELMHYLPVG